MNYRLVANYIAKILMLDAICMVPALLISLFQGESAAWTAFLFTVLVQIAFGGILLHIKEKNKRLYAREGFVIVALSWVLVSAFGAIPFTLSGEIPSYIDALFETISGFTTTGATILNDIESVPMGLLYWRSFTHWLGGMGILVFLLALAPLMRGNGMSLHILRAESPGPEVDKFAPKLHLNARILYTIYIGMTLLQIVLLLLGGMPLFDSVTTAFSSAGTGGFAIKNDSMASYSPYCQTVSAIFVMLFGVNFNIYFLMLIGDFRSAVKNGELRTYLGIIFASTAAITVAATSYFDSIGESLHHAFFQVTSIITTTGFISCDYELWPEITHTIILFLMVVGACAGSTGGGIKVSRLIILFKSIGQEIRHSRQPQSISVMTMDGSAVSRETARRCSAFFAAYVFTVIASTMILSIEGNSLETNLSAVIACINNVGPGLDLSGPTESFSFFSNGSKLVLMLNMLMGRLEMFPILILLSPGTWKNNN